MTARGGKEIILAPLNESMIVKKLAGIHPGGPHHTATPEGISNETNEYNGRASEQMVHGDFLVV
jgi:hypothetical protein